MISKQKFLEVLTVIEGLSQTEWCEVTSQVDQYFQRKSSQLRIASQEDTNEIKNQFLQHRMFE